MAPATALQQDPSFTPGPDVYGVEDAGLVSHSSWATKIEANGGAELYFEISGGGTSFFVEPPHLDPATGDLTYATAPDIHGSVTLGVLLVSDLGESDPAELTISISAVNDAPVATLASDWTETQAGLFQLHGSSIDDVDTRIGQGVDQMSMPMQATLSCTYGALSLPSAGPGITYLVGDGVNDELIVIEGELEDLSQALGLLLYVPGVSFHGSDTVRLTLDDLGHLGSGGKLIATDSSTISQQQGNFKTIAGLDLFATRMIDVRHSQVDGVMAGGKRVYLEHFSSAHRPELTPGTDVIIAGTRLVGMDGAVIRGNAVYGKSADLAPSVTFVDSSQPPRQGTPLNFPSLGKSIRDLSSSWGLTPPTGTTVIEDQTIRLDGMESDLNYFLVKKTDLEVAKLVIVSVPPGATSIINIDGGVVKSAHCGIQLQGCTAQQVVFNFFEAGRVVLSHYNLEGAVLAPFGTLTVLDIEVSGNLVAENLRLENTMTKGELFSTAPWEDSDSDDFYGDKSGADLPGYTLAWTPQSDHQLIQVEQVDPQVIKISTDGLPVRCVRLDRLERLVFVGRSDLSNILIDPEINLPIELSGLAPVAQDDEVKIWGSSATINPLENDLDGPSPLDPTSVQILTAPRFGTLHLDSLTGDLTYALNPSIQKPAGVDGEVFWYSVQDTAGNQCQPRRVRFTFASNSGGDLGRR